MAWLGSSQQLPFKKLKKRKQLKRKKRLGLLIFVREFWTMVGQMPFHLTFETDRNFGSIRVTITKNDRLGDPSIIGVTRAIGDDLLTYGDGSRVKGKRQERRV